MFYGLGGYGYSVVTTDSFLQYLIGFGQTTVTAGGGFDNAVMFDFNGNETFAASPTAASMSGASFVDTANGFDQVFAFANPMRDSTVVPRSASAVWARRG